MFCNMVDRFLTLEATLEAAEKLCSVSWPGRRVHYFIVSVIWCRVRKSWWTREYNLRNVIFNDIQEHSNSFDRSNDVREYSLTMELLYCHTVKHKTYCMLNYRLHFMSG